ncbi:MAG: ribulose-phosphate 3-epimerase [Oscillospiraceae bacterium]|nr:ribulose-phosphate 3-epimerase [Oscillospiraceae bacterium]
MIKIAPSILSADFSKLGEEISDVMACGADYIHFDVMDGMFVQNISFGIPVLMSVRNSTEAFIDVHLMIEQPLRYVKRFCEAGADLVNCHVEADSTENTIKALELIRSCGKKTGITLSPGTDADAVMPFIDMVDLVLVLTVYPGLGGQTLIYDQLDVVSSVRRIIDDYNPACELEVDGGITLETAAAAVSAGANVLVSGSTVFHSDNRMEIIRALRTAGKVCG